MPKPPSGEDFNIEVDLEPIAGAASLEVASLQADVRRLQRRIAGFEAANAELSAAESPQALSQVWSRVSTWGFEDAQPDDGVCAILAEATSEGAARARAEEALAELTARVAHLRRIPCRDCVVIPCPACSERAAAGVVRRASLDEK
jgi:hypothetical protein